MRKHAGESPKIPPVSHIVAGGLGKGIPAGEGEVGRLSPRKPAAVPSATSTSARELRWEVQTRGHALRRPQPAGRPGVCSHTGIVGMPRCPPPPRPSLPSLSVAIGGARHSCITCCVTESGKSEGGRALGGRGGAYGSPSAGRAGVRSHTEIVGMLSAS